MNRAETSAAAPKKGKAQDENEEQEVNHADKKWQTMAHDRQQAK